MPSILDTIGDTPLVRLRRLGQELPNPILVKCEHLNPGGSVKDRLALGIVDAAEKEGRLHPGDTLVEATAGNTGIGLALVAAVRGYSLVCVMPEKMSHDKRRALKALGAKLLITANAPPGDPENFQTVAARLATENGWFLTDQFCNPVNVDIHYRSTGPEILSQLGKSPGAFVAGVGTGGSLTGIGRFLKEHDPTCQIVLADPIGSSLASFVRCGLYEGDAPYLVEGIGSSKAPAIFEPDVVDRAIAVSDEESFSLAGRLMREEGLLVGGSAGTAVAAALQVAAEPERGPVVALLPDSWDRYLGTPWMEELAGQN